MEIDFSPMWISLKVAAAATVFSFFLGIAFAGIVVKMKRGKVIADAIFSLPMVLPPTVVGFFLLIIFGKNGFIGQLLNRIGVSVVFSVRGAIIAATVVSLPLMYRTARGAFEQVDPSLIYAAKTLGMHNITIFFKIILPISRPGILAGVVLSFTRAIGEFGATIMIAGNIPGKTQTMSVAIYTAMQSGNRELAYRWVLLIVGISFAAIAFLNVWTGLEKKIGERRHKK